MQPDIALAGLIVGILVGLTGVGGGALMAPLLILFAGVSPSMAIGTDLVYSTITKAAGAWQHWQQGTVNLYIVGLLSIGSIPGALIGVQTVHILAQRHGIDVQPILLRLLGITLLLISSMLLVRTLFPSFLRHTLKPLTRHWRSSTIVWGFIVGLLVGLTSVGSGSLVMPFLFLLPLTTYERVGTSVLQSVLMVGAAGILYAGHGQVDFALVGNLLLGSVPGILIGSRWMTRVSPQPLRLGLGSVLLLTAVKLIV